MRKYIIMLCIIALLVTLTGCRQEEVTAPEPDPPVVDEPQPEPPDPEPEPKWEPPLTEPQLERAFMAMIDNLGPARPQDGLDKADVVYEFISEATITRFLAAFYSEDPGKVGPVRSIRYYNVEMAKAYDAPFAHFGGSETGRAKIAELRAKSVCGVYNAASAFFRDPNRRAPHSTYTTSERIMTVARNRNWDATVLPHLPYSAPLTEGEAIEEVIIKYGNNYSVEWIYEADEGRYLRHINGNPHRTNDAGSIYGHNIIIIEAPVSTVMHPVNGLNSVLNVLSKGKAIFLRDGKVAHGIWEKTSPESHFQYTLNDGSAYEYAFGKVWIQQVSSLALVDLIGP